MHRLKSALLLYTLRRWGTNCVSCVRATWFLCVQPSRSSWLDGNRRRWGSRQRKHEQSGKWVLHAPGRACAAIGWLCRCTHMLFEHEW